MLSTFQLKMAKRGSNNASLMFQLLSVFLFNHFPGMGPFTLFAPDDAAFKKLTPGALDALLKDKTKLQGKLLYCFPFVEIQI